MLSCRLDGKMRYQPAARGRTPSVEEQLAEASYSTSRCRWIFSDRLTDSCRIWRTQPAAPAVSSGWSSVFQAPVAARSTCR
jgi:hypothetical protein